MKAWYLDRQEGLGALRLDASAPDPTPGEGEALVRVRYAALNPADRYLAEKLYPAKPTFPHILGRDAVGIVERFGPSGAQAAEGVAAPKEGAPALILRGGAGVDRPGTFADYVCVPADRLVSVPEGWEEEAASGAALVYLTAWQALTQWGEPEPGACVLVTGATGGVGLASCHLAHAMGLRVVGLTRSEEKGRRLKEQGVDLVLDPESDSLVKDVRAFAGKPGVAIAVDNIGGALFSKLVATLGHRGAVSCVGRLAGPVPDFNTATLFFRRNRIGGVSAGDYDTPEAHAAWKRIVALLKKSGARPVVDRVFPFEELLAAFEHLQNGPFGKVLLRVTDE